MKMLRFTIIYVFCLGLTLELCGCAHIRQTCDSYCLTRGGQCDHVEQGWTRYNTVTGATEERPTEFVCKYNW